MEDHNSAAEAGSSTHLPSANTTSAHQRPKSISQTLSAPSSLPPTRELPKLPTFTEHAATLLILATLDENGRDDFFDLMQEEERVVVEALLTKIEREMTLSTLDATEGGYLPRSVTAMMDQVEDNRSEHTKLKHNKSLEDNGDDDGEVSMDDDQFEYIRAHIHSIAAANEVLTAPQKEAKVSAFRVILQRFMAQEASAARQRNNDEGYPPEAAERGYSRAAHWMAEMHQLVGSSDIDFINDYSSTSSETRLRSPDSGNSFPSMPSTYLRAAFASAPAHIGPKLPSIIIDPRAVQLSVSAPGNLTRLPRSPRMMFDSSSLESSTISEHGLEGPVRMTKSRPGAVYPMPISSPPLVKRMASRPSAISEDVDSILSSNLDEHDSPHRHSALNRLDEIEKMSPIAEPDEDAYGGEGDSTLIVFQSTPRRHSSLRLLEFEDLPLRSEETVDQVEPTLTKVLVESDAKPRTMRESCMNIAEQRLVTKRIEEVKIRVSLNGGGYKRGPLEESNVPLVQERCDQVLDPVERGFVATQRLPPRDYFVAAHVFSDDLASINSNRLSWKSSASEDDELETPRAVPSRFRSASVGSPTPRGLASGTKPSSFADTFFDPFNVIENSTDCSSRGLRRTLTSARSSMNLLQDEKDAILEEGAGKENRGVNNSCIYPHRPSQHCEIGRTFGEPLSEADDTPTKPANERIRSVSSPTPKSTRSSIARHLSDEGMMDAIIWPKVVCVTQGLPVKPPAQGRSRKNSSPLFHAAVDPSPVPGRLTHTSSRLSNIVQPRRLTNPFGSFGSMEIDVGKTMNRPSVQESNGVAKETEIKVVPVEREPRKPSVKAAAWEKLVVQKDTNTRIASHSELTKKPAVIKTSVSERRLQYEAEIQKSKSQELLSKEKRAVSSASLSAKKWTPKQMDRQNSGSLYNPAMERTPLQNNTQVKQKFYEIVKERTPNQYVVQSNSLFEPDQENPGIMPSTPAKATPTQVFVKSRERRHESRDLRPDPSYTADIGTPRTRSLVANLSMIFEHLPLISSPEMPPLPTPRKRSPLKEIQAQPKTPSRCGLQVPKLYASPQRSYSLNIPGLPPLARHLFPKAEGGPRKDISPVRAVSQPVSKKSMQELMAELKRAEERGEEWVGDARLALRYSSGEWEVPYSP